MKNITIKIVIVIFLLFPNFTYSIDFSFNDKEQAFIGDIGIGNVGLSIGAGYRIWFGSLTIGYAGLFNTIPAYSMQIPQNFKIRPNEPLPNGFREDSYVANMINIDLNFYYENFLPFILTGGLGYYSQSDTLTAYHLESNSRYYYKTINTSGICYSIGAEYQINDIICIGALFHSRRSLLVRFTYFLF